MISSLRILGTIIGIVGYALLSNGHSEAGAIMNLGTQALFTPFNIQQKCWDLVGTGAFFAGISIHSLLT